MLFTPILILSNISVPKVKQTVAYKALLHNIDIGNIYCTEHFHIYIFRLQDFARSNLSWYIKGPVVMSNAPVHRSNNNNTHTHIHTYAHTHTIMKGIYKRFWNAGNSTNSFLIWNIILILNVLLFKKKHHCNFNILDCFLAFSFARIYFIFLYLFDILPSDIFLWIRWQGVINDAYTFVCLLLLFDTYSKRNIWWHKMTHKRLCKHA